MSKIGFAHFIFALAALLSGATVLLRRKGTLGHRCVGYVYACCMFGLNGTALLIYRLFRAPGPFHVLAVISLATLIAGLLPALRRQAGWLERHYRLMAWSYVGLCAAALAEFAVRLPFVHGIGWRFGSAAFIASALVAAIGGRVIEHRRKSVLALMLKSPPLV
jgi:uncharacterized membrane protein